MKALSIVRTLTFVIILLVFIIDIVSCETTFLTTLFAYLFLLLTGHFIFRRFQVSVNKRLAIYTVLVTLFAGEFFLRFIIKYPITYSEANGHGYFSQYHNQQVSNFFYRHWKGDKQTLHLHTFEPYSLNNPADAEGNIRPREKYNALGMRGKLPAKNKKVVMCMGDSFTESVCATIDSSYPVLLENQLQTLDTNIEVLNAGISGNDPFFDFKMLQHLNGKYNFSSIVFLVNTTDIDGVISHGGMERFAPDGTLSLVPTPWWERLYAVSFVFRTFMHKVLKMDYTFYTQAEHKTLEQAAVVKLQGLFRDYVIPYCRQKGIKIVVALHPVEVELKSAERYQQLSAALKTLPGATVTDTYDLIKQQNEAGTIYYPVDKHFNGRGYAIIANSVYQAIIKSGI